MNDVQLALLAARTLISDPKDWTQMAAGATKDGTPVLASDEHACRWCAVGALIAVRSGLTEPAMNALDSAAKSLFARTHLHNAVTVNDNLGHKAVMRMYDRAIELAA